MNGDILNIDVVIFNGCYGMPVECFVGKPTADVTKITYDCVQV